MPHPGKPVFILKLSFVRSFPRSLARSFRHFLAITETGSKTEEHTTFVTGAAAARASYRYKTYIKDKGPPPLCQPPLWNV